MGERRRRICDYCGFLTEEEYTDEEWDAVGHECEECIDANSWTGLSVTKACDSNLC